MFKDYDYFGAFMMVIGAAAFAALGWGSITGKLPKKPRGDYDWIPSVALASGQRFRRMDYPDIVWDASQASTDCLLGWLGTRGRRSKRELMEIALPSHYEGVWLAGGRLPMSASPPLERLLKGVERVASIRAEIASTAKVATMPPVEVVPYIWTHDRALICGRVTTLRQGDSAYFGVQLPAPTALCTDRAAVRALLVHEFAHWFYIATRVVNGSEFGENAGGTLDLRNEGLTESDTQINARDWFGEEDARSFIQHGDSTTSGISRQAIGLETHFYVVTPRLGDTVGRIDISDDVKAHIRRLRAKRGH